MSGVKHDALSDIVGFERIIAVPVLPAIGARSTSEIVEFGDGVSPSGERLTNRPCPRLRYKQPGVKSVTQEFARWCPSVTAGVRWCPLVPNCPASPLRWDLSIESHRCS
jgi:hypothetical protein